MSTAIAIRPELQTALDLANDGALIREICAKLGIATTTLTEWQVKDARFRALFAQARENGLHLLADSLVGLPDEYADVQKARLKSDNIKWLLARKLSRVYGDRLDVNVSGTIDLAGTLIEARQRALSQPMRNQQEIEDAQVIDAEWECAPETTDKESVPDDGDIFA